MQMKNLPKWAQSKITTLESDIAGLEKKLAAVSGLKETDIWIDVRGVCKHDRLYVPSNAGITINLKNGELRVFIKEGRLYLMGMALGRSELNVMPQASNVVTVGFHE